MSNVQRSKADMDAATSHTVYEFQMLTDTASLLSRGLGTGVTRNALLESELLHARNVIEFLLGRPKKVRFDSRDISARSFVSEW
jgi:hypothetical protein